MPFLELFAIAAGLSMDAFAVAVCKGFALKKVRVRDSVKVGLYFGIAQAAMPLIGFILAGRFANAVSAVAHWIAFAVLGIIGLKMIIDAVRGGTEEHGAVLSLKEMLPLAVATSLDALAVGISLAFLKADVVSAAGLIGVTTFLLSGAGVFAGSKVGESLGSKAEILGGIVLIVFAVKIVLGH
ncbi:MAG: manganese efflux pump MntP family protein [Oscillospiraceae bacterium]|jgi:putative Mn2+ efflux pump MntP|nr:manganese efflux pump MntP family protein [Oscillospiraceae bacterium]